MAYDGIVACKIQVCSLSMLQGIQSFPSTPHPAELHMRQVVADAQHTEQLATLSRRRSEVRVSALEDMI